MANGDVAAAAGLPVVSSAADIRMGYDAINELADSLGTFLLSGTRTIGQVVSLSAALAGKASTSHTHTIAGVTGLTSALATHTTRLDGHDGDINWIISRLDAHGI